MNPGIVTLDMSGFGATGPDAERISWGPVLDAASGLAFTTGYPDSGSYKQGIAFPDVVGGLHGTVVALAALWQHWRSAEPVAVDLSQLETAIAVAGEQFGEASLRPAGSALPPRRGARSRDAAPAGVYRCRGEDAWLALTITDDEAWQALAGFLRSELGDECCQPEWTEPAVRHGDHDAIDAVIERWTSTRDKHEAAAKLQAAGIAASAAMTIATSSQTSTASPAVSWLTSPVPASDRSCSPAWRSASRPRPPTSVHRPSWASTTRRSWLNSAMGPTRSPPSTTATPCHHAAQLMHERIGGDACQPRLPQLCAEMPPQSAKLHKEGATVVSRTVTYPRRPFRPSSGRR